MPSLRTIQKPTAPMAQIQDDRMSNGSKMGREKRTLFHVLSRSLALISRGLTPLLSFEHLRAMSCFYY